MESVVLKVDIDMVSLLKLKYVLKIFSEWEKNQADINPPPQTPFSHSPEYVISKCLQEIKLSSI